MITCHKKEKVQTQSKKLYNKLNDTSGAQTTDIR